MNNLLDSEGKTVTSEMIYDNLVWLNSADAAMYLRKTQGALRVAVCRGHIKAYKWRRRLFFKRRDLDLMLENAFKKGGILCRSKNM